MRFALYFVAVALSSLLSLWIFPWWFIAIGGLVAGILAPMRFWVAFSAAFGAGFALWFGQAWILDAGNQSILSGRIGALFQGLSRWQLMQITGLIGGLLGGLGAMTGVSLRPAPRSQRARSGAYGPRRRRRR